VTTTVTVYLGTSGWQYKDWRGRFYPEGVAQKRWLEFYAERFDTVESNNAFYRLPERKTFQNWKERTHDDFVWAVKASRFLTHMKRLKDPHEPVKRFLDHARGLGAKLGPVLLQLPPNFHADLDRLDAALDRFPRTVRVAVEPRHDSWFNDELEDLLERRGAALCLADRGSQPVTPVWRTTDWGYVRFHAGTASPEPCYGRSALRTWAERLADLFGRRTDVFVYFNNDPEGCALRDVRVFARAVERAGLQPTRVPGEAVPVG
jgi:uncharacterized protein YecE (DUF72 family)